MNDIDINTRTVFTACEVADLMKVSVSHVYESLRRGDLPCVKMGRRRVIPARPILRMMGLDEVATPAYGEIGGA